MSTTEVIRDESHARAILKSIERAIALTADPDRIQEFSDHMVNVHGGNHKKFEAQLASLKCLLGNTLIMAARHPIKRASKREIALLVCFGADAIDSHYTEAVKADKMIPITLITLRSWVPMDDSTQLLMLLSNHAAERMILRHSLLDIKSFATFLRAEIFCAALKISNVTTEVGFEYVVITPEAYMIMVTSKLDVPIVKTWVSRRAWTQKTEAKLFNLCEHLRKEGELRFVSLDTFEHSTYLDPSDASLFLLGAKLDSTLFLVLKFVSEALQQDSKPVAVQRLSGKNS